MRCFLAMELPERALRALDSAGRTIRGLDPAWAGEKWATTGVLHITLKFLGELEEADMRGIQAGFAAAASVHPAFGLTPSGFRAVPNDRRAKMIWLGLADASGGCAALAQAADKVAERYGVPPESRHFAPHVTLVRARRPRPVQASTLVQAARTARLDAIGEMSVLSASLFASTLTPRGPIHERLAEFVLGVGEGR